MIQIAWASLPRSDKTMRSLLLRSFAVAFVLAPGLALAHPGFGGAHDFAHGFGHPLLGLDHILAMVTVGILAWQLGGRALWLVPTTFVTVMAVGAVFGASGLPLPFVETGIALSVVVLGAIVAFGLRTPVAMAMGLVGLFALFHGHAHGTEMPLDVGSIGYAFGFMGATALLHLAGIGSGFLLGRLSAASDRLGYRLSGGFVSLAGLVILLRAI
jgi:urease accessory protein